MEHGIVHERTPPFSPLSNGTAKRKNHTLIELVNAMLCTPGLSKEWWGETLIACHVLNRVPMKDKEITPFEEWEKRRLNHSYLRTWGCLAKVNVPINKKCKLGHKTVDCVFPSYSFHNTRYMFLIIKFDVPDMYIDAIMESRYTTFFENEFPMKNTPSETSHETIISHEHELSILIDHVEDSHEHIPEVDDTVVTSKSKRPRVAKSFGDDFIVYLVKDTPTTIVEAYSSPDANLWKETVRSEMESIMSNRTWKVVDRPYGCQPIGCKWIFKKKLRPDGTIERYKARLVAKGYT